MAFASSTMKRVLCPPSAQRRLYLQAIKNALLLPNITVKSYSWFPFKSGIDPSTPTSNPKTNSCQNPLSTSPQSLPPSASFALSNESPTSISNPASTVNRSFSNTDKGSIPLISTTDMEDAPLASPHKNSSDPSEEYNKSDKTVRRRKRAARDPKMPIPNVFTKDPNSKQGYDGLFPNLHRRLIWANENKVRFDNPHSFPYQIDPVVTEELVGLVTGLVRNEPKLNPILCLTSPDHRAGKLLVQTGQALANILGADICTIDVTDISLVTRALMAFHAGKFSWDELRDPHYLIERLNYDPCLDQLDEEDSDASFGSEDSVNNWFQFIQPTKNRTNINPPFQKSNSSLPNHFGTFSPGLNGATGQNLGHFMSKMLYKDHFSGLPASNHPQSLSLSNGESHIATGVSNSSSNTGSNEPREVDLYTSLCYIFGAIRQARENHTLPHHPSPPLTIIHLTGFEHILERAKDRDLLVAFATESSEYIQKRGERILVLLNEHAKSGDSATTQSSLHTSQDENTAIMITPNHSPLTSKLDSSIPRQYAMYIATKKEAKQQVAMTLYQENMIDWLVSKRFVSLRSCVLCLKTIDNDKQLDKDHAERVFGFNYWRIIDVMSQLAISTDNLPAKEDWDLVLPLGNLPKLLQNGPLDLPEAICLAYLASSHSSAAPTLESLFKACLKFSHARTYQQLHFNIPETMAQIGPSSATYKLDPKNLSKYEKRLLPCIVTPDMVTTRFKDIGSLDKVKRTLHELISLPLEKPEWFRTGILKEAVSGILLFGPPGTGKTMLAKAVAAQSGANFIAVNSSSIYDMYVGEGEKNAKALFSLARKLSPCIIFVDEVDALLDSRTNSIGRASRVEILNEFMSEWDGLLSQNNRVLVMAATNRPFALDDAVLRRLPRRILVDLPDSKARTLILQLLLQDDKLESDICLEKLGQITEYYSGSDLKNLCIAAGLAALRELPIDSTKPTIGWKHLELAMSDVPPSISDQTETLTELRKWDQVFGEGRKKATKGLMGFYPSQM